MKKIKPQSNIKQFTYHFQLNDIIKVNKEVADYFNTKNRSTEENYQLIIQLLYEAVLARKKNLSSTSVPLLHPVKQQVFYSPSGQFNNIQNCENFPPPQNPKSSNKTLGNVTYIKRNRFLSPNKKQQITRKVTEVIPSLEKHVIHGKPKISLNQGEGCPLNPNCQQLPKENQFQAYGENHQQIPFYFQYEQDSNNDLYPYNNSSQQNPQIPNYPPQHNSLNPSSLSPLTIQPDSVKILDLPRQYSKFLSPQSSGLNKKTGKLKNKKDGYGTEDLSMTLPVKGKLPNSSFAHNQKELNQKERRTQQLERKLRKQQTLIMQLQQRQQHIIQLQNYQRMIEHTSVHNHQEFTQDGRRYKFLGCEHHYPNPKHQCLSCKLQKLQVDDKNNKLAMKELDAQNKRRKSQLSVELGSNVHIGQTKSYQEIGGDNEEISEMLSQQISDEEF